MIGGGGLKNPRDLPIFGTMKRVPPDRGPNPSEESAAEATQPSEATLETLETLELAHRSVVIRITDEQAERIFQLDGHAAC
jgi:hypothetical protein